MPVDYAGLRDRAARLDELPRRDFERLELQISRAASKQRLLLQRSPRFDRRATEAGQYRLVNGRNGEVVAGSEGSGYSLTLGKVVEVLASSAPARESGNGAGPKRV